MLTLSSIPKLKGEEAVDDPVARSGIGSAREAATQPRKSLNFFLSFICSRLPSNQADATFIALVQDRSRGTITDLGLDTLGCQAHSLASQFARSPCSHGPVRLDATSIKRQSEMIDFRGETCRLRRRSLAVD